MNETEAADDVDEQEARESRSPEEIALVRSHIRARTGASQARGYLQEPPKVSWSPWRPPAASRPLLERPKFAGPTGQRCAKSSGQWFNFFLHRARGAAPGVPRRNVRRSTPGQAPVRSLSTAPDTPGAHQQGSETSRRRYRRGSSRSKIVPSWSRWPPAGPRSREGPSRQLQEAFQESPQKQESPNSFSVLELFGAFRIRPERAGASWGLLGRPGASWDLLKCPGAFGFPRPLGTS